MLILRFFIFIFILSVIITFIFPLVIRYIATPLIRLFKEENKLWSKWNNLWSGVKVEKKTKQTKRDRR